MTYIPPNIKEIGLQKHLGDKRYAELLVALKFAKLPSGKYNVSTVARSIGVDWKTANKYVDAYVWELEKGVRDDI